MGSAFSVALVAGGLLLLALLVRVTDLRRRDRAAPVGTPAGQAGSPMTAWWPDSASLAPGCSLGSIPSTICSIEAAVAVGRLPG